MRFHTNLPVANIDETANFYSALFDSAPVKKKRDYVKFLPDDVALNISFHQSSDKKIDPSTLHLGFELPDQASLDRVHARLTSAGLISQERETSVCCYANQDKFWVKDPDGYEWELYVLIEDTEKKIDTKTACCPGASAGATAGGPCC